MHAQHISGDSQAGIHNSYGSMQTWERKQTRPYLQ